MHNVQLLAARAVTRVLDGRSLNQVLEASNRAQPDISPSQRAALQDLSYTTLRWLGRLQAIADALIDRPPSDRVLQCLIWVALGQLEFGKSPPYAVVDNAVRATRAMGKPGARGLVNAVLRNFLRKRSEIIQLVDQKAASHFAYPEWWISKLKTQHPDAWEGMLMAGNGHPPMTLRTNRRKIGRNEYLEALMKSGIPAMEAGDCGVRLHRPMPVEKLPGFYEGQVSVQDLGAQHAARLLDLRDGMRVLDACSAPGGKTAHLLELAEIDLLALDQDEFRLAKVRENLQRLGLQAEVRVGDAGQPGTWWDGRPFDRILADVPCSASGIVRRHPDIKWLRRPEDVEGFAAQQARILKGLWPTLAKGGKLLYATCSVFHEENSDQIAAFLAAQPDARQLPLVDLGDGQLLPCEQHDGFYYALLQKI